MPERGACKARRRAWERRHSAGELDDSPLLPFTWLPGYLIWLILSHLGQLAMLLLSQTGQPLK